MTVIQARVRRDGQLAEIPAGQLVPGDIVAIEAGDVVPADGRLLKAATLEASAGSAGTRWSSCGRRSRGSATIKSGH